MIYTHRHCSLVGGLTAVAAWNSRAARACPSMLESGPRSLSNWTKVNRWKEALTNKVRELLAELCGFWTYLGSEMCRAFEDRQNGSVRPSSWEVPSQGVKFIFKTQCVRLIEFFQDRKKFIREKIMKSGSSRSAFRAGRKFIEEMKPIRPRLQISFSLVYVRQINEFFSKDSSSSNSMWNI